MRRTAVTFACAAVALAVVFAAGCEKPPEADIAAAKAAIEEARKTCNGRWAQAWFAHAESLHKDAGTEIAAQQAGFALSRDYSKAKEILAAAKADADAARAAATAERENARREATDALRRVRTMLQGARAALQIAPSPRDGKADLARLRAELQSVESDLGAAQSLLDAEDFRPAAAKADALSARVEAAVTRFFDEIAR